MYERLAQIILFSSRKSTNAAQLQVDLDHLGLEYRKGKTFSDVIAAVRKGVKAGSGRTEFELNMIEVYLKNVFKVKRK